MMIKNISTNNIEETVNRVLKLKQEDINSPPDVDILHTDTYFYAKIRGNRININTGRGGLKMFLKEIKGLTFLKINYNGKTLTLQQKQELYDKI